MSMGPVEYVVIAFPGNRFRGEIAPELKKLVASATVRIIDLSFVKKSADGSVEYLELANLDPDESVVFDDIEGEISGLLNDEDLALIADELVPDSSAALLVWEDTWAAGIVGAIQRAGGQLIAHERVPAALVEQALSTAD